MSASLSAKLSRETLSPPFVLSFHVTKWVRLLQPACFPLRWSAITLLMRLQPEPLAPILSLWGRLSAGCSHASSGHSGLAAQLPSPSLSRLRPHAYLPWWEKTGKGEICHRRRVFRRNIGSLSNWKWSLQKCLTFQEWNLPRLSSPRTLSGLSASCKRFDQLFCRVSSSFPCYINADIAHKNHVLYHVLSRVLYYRLEYYTIPHNSLTRLRRWHQISFIVFYVQHILIPVFRDTCDSPTDGGNNTLHGDEDLPGPWEMHPLCWASPELDPYTCACAPIHSY